MSDFYNSVLEVLRQDERFFSVEGTLLRNSVYEAAMQMDAGLLRLLLGNADTKAAFFTDIDGTLVFDKVKFGWVINNRQFLPDSYTRFQNKIGLADENGELLSSSGKVELVFPYKDCVLEGGQTKEDQKRSEIFYNETLAPDEVDRLLYPKVLVNAKRYSYDGEYDLTGQPTGEGSVKCEATAGFADTDNLIIKGNNLLALASLLKRFEGKVKCIYIDPPYNTETDSFGYNDKFNRSSWLVFMKNRLELAKRLLSNDGAIYVQVDYHQAHYVKVLMDEVFGEDNFQREVIWRIGWLSGYKTIDKNWIRNHDTILFYSKNCNALKFNKYYIPKSEFKDIANSSAEQYPIEDVWNGSEYDDLNSIAIVSFSGETVSKMLNPNDEVKGQKSEKLIERIIKAHTDEGDLVLDFFGGTGTTAAVCTKMKRRFIVCEQLDKHIDIILRRMNKVLIGEQSGISKNNNWHGGGSFVYCELAKLNQRFVDKIEDSADDDTMSDLYRQIVDTGFISSKVNPKDIDAVAEDFEALSLADKKRFLMELLDKNLLYVNLCDLDDEEFAISDTDKAFTKSFYREV